MENNVESNSPQSVEEAREVIDGEIDRLSTEIGGLSEEEKSSRLQDMRVRLQSEGLGTDHLSDGELIARFVHAEMGKSNR